MKTIYVMLTLIAGHDVPHRWAVVADYPTLAVCEADKVNHPDLAALKCVPVNW